MLRILCNTFIIKKWRNGLLLMTSAALLTACFGNFGCGFSKSSECDTAGVPRSNGPRVESLSPMEWPYTLPRGGVYLYAYTPGLQDDFKDIVPVNLAGALTRLRDVPGEEVSAAQWEALDKEEYEKNERGGKGVKWKKPDHYKPFVYNEFWVGAHADQILPRIIARIPGDGLNRLPPPSSGLLSFNRHTVGCLFLAVASKRFGRG